MKKITVTVKLYSALDKHVENYNPSTGIEKTLDEGATVGDLIKALGLSPKSARIVLVENMVRNLDEQVFDGELIQLFSPIGGG